MTPEELEAVESALIEHITPSSVWAREKIDARLIDRVPHLIKALREAWQERDRLRTCKHADQFYMTNPPRCMECGWTGDPPWSIARAEREECAKLADAEVAHYRGRFGTADTYRDMERDAEKRWLAEKIAQAIRARGNPENK